MNLGGAFMDLYYAFTMGLYLPLRKPDSAPDLLFIGGDGWGPMLLPPFRFLSLTYRMGVAYRMGWKEIAKPELINCGLSSRYGLGSRYGAKHEKPKAYVFPVPPYSSTAAESTA